MKIFILLLALGFSTAGIAQQVEIQLGNEYPIPRSGIDRVFGSDDDGFYEIRQERNKLVLSRYIFPDMKMSFSRDIPLSHGRENLEFNDIFRLKDKIVVFATTFDRSQNKESALVLSIHLDGKIDGRFREVDNLQVKRRRQTGNFSFMVSKDRSKILIVKTEPFDKYANEAFSYKVMDADFNELWSKDIVMPYKDADFRISNYTIENDGNVYMLARITDENMRRSKRDQPNYTYNILGYFHEDDDLIEYNLRLRNFFLTDVTFLLDGSGNLITSGFYSKTRNSGINGSFLITINSTSKEVIADGYSEFDTNFISEAVSSKAAKKGGGVRSYDLRNMVLREDGGVLLVAEQFYVVQRCNTDQNGVTTCTYYYYYNDIIVVNMDKNGKMDWAHIIPKRQVTSGTSRYLSFLMAVSDNKLVFVFNDHAKNAERTITSTSKISTMTKPAKSVATMVTISSDKEVERTALFKTKETKALVMPRIYLQNSENEIIFYSTNKRKYKYGKFIIN